MQGSADEALDHVDVELHDWKNLKKACTMGIAARLASR